METAHPPSSLSTLWSWTRCTHAPLIGSSAPSGVSWMCALLTRIQKPSEKLLRWGGSGKTTLGFWLFPYCWPSSGLKGKSRWSFVFTFDFAWVVLHVLFDIYQLVFFFFLLHLFRFSSSASRILRIRAICLLWRKQWTGWWKDTTFGWGRILGVTNFLFSFRAPPDVRYMLNESQNPL